MGPILYKLWFWFVVVLFSVNEQNDNIPAKKYSLAFVT